MNLQKKISIIVFSGILVIIVLFAIFRQRALKSNFAIEKGYIYEFGNSRSSGNRIFFKFRFSLKGVTYYGNSAMPCARENKIHFQSWTYGKSVQVIYNKANPDNCRLLLTKEDYKKYGLSVPEVYRVQTDLIDSLCN